MTMTMNCENSIELSYYFSKSSQVLSLYCPKKCSSVIKYTRIEIPIMVTTVKIKHCNLDFNSKAIFYFLQVLPTLCRNSCYSWVGEWSFFAGICYIICSHFWFFSCSIWSDFTQNFRRLTQTIQNQMKNQQELKFFIK